MNIHINASERGRGRKNERFSWTPENMAFAADLWANGHTSTHIAQQLGISRSSFAGVAGRNRDLFPAKTANGIPTPKTEQWTAEKVDACIRLRRAGITMKAIAEIIGMRKATVENLVRKRRDLFEVEQPAKQEAAAPRQVRRSFVGDRWVARVPYTTFAGAIVSLPHISLINGPEA